MDTTHSSGRYATEFARLARLACVRAQNGRIYVGVARPGLLMRDREGAERGTESRVEKLIKLRQDAGRGFTRAVHGVKVTITLVLCGEIMRYETERKESDARVKVDLHAFGGCRLVGNFFNCYASAEFIELQWVLCK